MIAYFSGAGNSRHIAMRLHLTLGDALMRIGAGGIEAPVPEGERVIWVFPIHCWGLPKPVVNAIRHASCNGRDHFMICTYGDDCGYADSQWRREINARGGRPVAVLGIQMPNTYVILPGFDVDTPEVVAAKDDNEVMGACRANAVIHLKQQVNEVCHGRFPWIKSRILYPLFMHYMLDSRPFRVDTGKCIRCGECVRACMTGNLKFGKSGFPEWDNHCSMCLGCYHNCRHDAIHYGNRTKGKGRYIPKF